jgi:hypothetical protein
MRGTHSMRKRRAHWHIYALGFVDTAFPSVSKDQRALLALRFSTLCKNCNEPLIAHLNFLGDGPQKCLFNFTEYEAIDEQDDEG